MVAAARALLAWDPAADYPAAVHELDEASTEAEGIELSIARAELSVARRELMARSSLQCDWPGCEYCEGQPVRRHQCDMVNCSLCAAAAD